MQVRVHGCRGSIPVAGTQFQMYGGNTTCIRILSDHLPAGSALILDAGSGLMPASRELLAEGIKKVYILFTHYHWDHTIGLSLSPLMFHKGIPIIMGGPVEAGIGTREACEALFRQPFFPVDYREVGSHIHHLRFDVPGTQLILMHRSAGHAILDRDEFESLVAQGKQMPFDAGSWALEECLVVHMLRSNHPERTISYRIEERPSGQSFALLTDHENQDGIPQALKRHLKKVDVLIADCQYTREQYNGMTAGFGHGTPDYVVKLARAVEAKRLVLTHHDPGAGDDEVDRILEDARSVAREMEGAPSPDAIESAKDGSTYSLGD